MGDDAGAELLRRAAGGDRGAARALIDAAGPTVYGYVFARLGGDRAAAEDVVQDTFLEAVRSADTFRGEASLTTWMCTIARRRLARHYEAERREATAREELREELIEEAPAGAVRAVHTAGGAEGPTDVEDRDLVVRGLARLPIVHRQVLVLKYLDDEPVAEIARQLGRTRVQVQSLLQRARDGLRRELEALT